MKNKRVAVGLSGGVDSAVSAALLQEQGYEVTGVFLVCYEGLGCRTNEDRKDALDVALKSKIPFEVLDYRKEYQAKVLEYFKSEYEAGRTPNPDVVCNREIKFGLFYDWCLDKGFDFIATGHYARIAERQQPDLDVLAASHKMAASGSARQSRVCCLQQSIDLKKDQTYFLYQLRQEQLEHILFPIGGMTKEEVRQKAKELKLPVANKPDSQGICFVGEVPILEFLKKMGVREKEGEVVNTQGKIIGKHKGVWFYTIGQRHGFTIQNNTPDSKPLFILKKDIQNNILVVGSREECLQRELEVGNIHLVNKDSGFKIQDSKEIAVRIRHGGELIGVKRIIEKTKNRLMIQLEKGVFGVSSGQAVVFYGGDLVLGGGIII